MTKRNSDICPICGQYVEVVVSAYGHQDFIDGRRYDEICFVCASVPKMSEYHPEKGLVVYSEFDIRRLNSVQDMVEDGWDRKRVEASIKAVKRAIKR